MPSYLTAAKTRRGARSPGARISSNTCSRPGSASLNGAQVGTSNMSDIKADPEFNRHFKSTLLKLTEGSFLSLPALRGWSWRTWSQLNSKTIQHSWFLKKKKLQHLADTKMKSLFKKLSQNSDAKFWNIGEFNFCPRFKGNPSRTDFYFLQCSQLMLWKAPSAPQTTDHNYSN